MNTKLKKALYESIMKSVAKTVKKALNENIGQYYVYTDDDDIYKYVYFASTITEEYLEYLTDTDDENPDYTHNTVTYNIVSNIKLNYDYIFDLLCKECNVSKDLLRIMLNIRRVKNIDIHDEFIPDVWVLQ